MAATLDDLANLDGVIMAFEFAPDGTLKQYKAPGNVPQELAQQAATYSATVTMLFGTLAGAFTQLSQMPWTPQRGWAYAGGQYSVCIGNGGYRGLFIETAKADFNRLFQLLTA